jgi:hypothetical protein
MEATFIHYINNDVGLRLRYGPLSIRQLGERTIGTQHHRAAEPAANFRHTLESDPEWPRKRPTAGARLHRRQTHQKALLAISPLPPPCTTQSHRQATQKRPRLGLR